MKMNFKKGFKFGFTLIELLVVVAIIGILASVVLASLNTARTKGADAAIKANLTNTRAQAALFYDPSNTYLNVCSTAGTGIGAGVLAASTAAGTGTVVVGHPGTTAQTTTTANCNDDVGGYAASVKLKNGSNYFCVDSAGAAKETALLPAGEIVCP